MSAELNRGRGTIERAVELIQERDAAIERFIDDQSASGHSISLE